ncbi:hypothetical protein H0E87_003732 [Populus deltoides]|uniref:Uncharacterized protein n=1 Tax=Populus deltoides TaxID=3696 RepID=A0A8T2ZBK4_POPDE|nr:hypothetical protein H0E87_003732 [Populus deltoides]
MGTRAGSQGEAPLAFTNSQLESLCFSSHDDGVLTMKVDGWKSSRCNLGLGQASKGTVLLALLMTRHAALIFHLIRQDIPKSLQVVALVRYTKFPNSMAGIKRRARP